MPAGPFVFMCVCVSFVSDDPRRFVSRISVRAYELKRIYRKFTSKYRNRRTTENQSGGEPYIFTYFYNFVYEPRTLRSRKVRLGTSFNTAD